MIFVCVVVLLVLVAVVVVVALPGEERHWFVAAVATTLPAVAAEHVPYIQCELMQHNHHSKDSCISACDALSRWWCCTMVLLLKRAEGYRKGKHSVPLPVLIFNEYQIQDPSQNFPFHFMDFIVVNDSNICSAFCESSSSKALKPQC